jgi:Na+/H+-dicarboxylate symporter
VVPTNPFKALSDGKVLQIIFFSALVGVAWSRSATAPPTPAVWSMRARPSSSASPAG